jgi:hypothetical protein
MRRFTILALAVAIGLGTAFSPFASGAPDGLSKVAERQGFDRRARAQDGPAAGYAFPGVRDARVAKGAAGFAGTLGVFLLGAGAAAAIRRLPARARAA